MLNDLKELIEFESLLSAPEKNAPYGKNMRDTLDWFLKKAESYGLKTGEKDGHYGYAEVGEGKELIGILCHLDVVPPGSGWTYNPFTLTIDGGKLYGRGVVDDKGPTVAMLHLLKKLHDEKTPLNHRIRLIVGCNEENGSSCIKHYKKHGEIPKLSLVPDADFPVINSEKCIFQFELEFKTDKVFDESVIEIIAGSRPNVVPDTAKITVKKDTPLANEFLKIDAACASDLLQKNTDFSVIDLGDKIVVETYGIAGHAMAPDKADNAIYKLFALLNGVESSVTGETLNLIGSRFANNLCREHLGIAQKDEKSGELTMNIGAIKTVKNKIILTVDLRLPLCADKDKIADKIVDASNGKAKLTVLHYAPNLYMDEDSYLVKTLVDIYTKVTGKVKKPLQIGGGTYARELPNAIAFGVTEDDDDTRIHNSDENISLEHFNRWIDIYREAILALDKA